MDASGRNLMTRLVSAALLAASASLPHAAEPLLIEGAAYAMPEDLATAGVRETFATVDRIDTAPAGGYAVAVHFDTDDEVTDGEEPTSQLLVLDLKEKKAVREIWAWRTTTYAGEWREDGRYHFYGGPPSDPGRPEFRYDPNTNLVDDTY